MRARSNIAKLLVVGSLTVALCGATTVGAVAQPLPQDVACRPAGLMNASAMSVEADTFVIPFAAHSSELTPVAEEVLHAAAAAYPATHILYLRIQGGEPEGTTETLVSIDRLTWVTAFLAARDVPLQAMVFEAPSVAKVGCAQAPLKA